MNLSLVSIITTLEPVVYIAALVPVLIAIIMWAVFYSQYDTGKLKKIGKSFKRLADDGAKIKDCKRENIFFMDEMVVRMAPPYFLEAWLRMLMQLEKNYKGEFIPDGQSFYDFDAMVEVPGCRSRLNSLWKSFWILSLVTLVLPVGLAYFVQPRAIFDALALGGVLFILLCLGELIFTMRDQKMYFSTKTEYHRFIDTFNRVLPVAKAEVAMLLEATQKNQEAYQAATQKIVEKFDTIVDDVLLPVLENSVEIIVRSNLVPALQNIEKTLDKTMNKTLELQENGMERMTAAFADRLIEALEQKMFSLAITVSNVQGQMEELNLSLGKHVAELMETTKSSIELQKEQTANSIALQDEHIANTIDQQNQQMIAITTSFTESLTCTLHNNVTSLNQEIGNIQTLMGELNIKLATNIENLSVMLNEQRNVFEESAKILINSAEVQEMTIAQTKEIQSKAVENNQILNQHVQMMADTVDKLTEQTVTFSNDAFKFTKETNETQIRMSEGIKLSQANLEAVVNETMSQYTKMNSMISDMMDNITERMNEAMTNAGREIAHGIKEATADNAEAISMLTEQAQNLRGDYDTYFSRLEGSTLKTLDDMDYQMKGIIARITEDIGAMMKENTSANAEILEKYKDNTVDLLQSFDEQARSIGLYAKEINMDITDLSNNLQASVGEFSSKIQEGLRVTFSEFDSGLSELTQRIANTVESISDAVESLPEALSKR